MKKRENKLFVVIPCYNEEEVLHETTKRLKEKLETLIKNKVISKDSKVMYVNDGSKDKTWELIKEISEKEMLSPNPVPSAFNAASRAAQKFARCFSLRAVSLSAYSNSFFVKMRCFLNADQSKNLSLSTMSIPIPIIIEILPFVKSFMRILVTFNRFVQVKN